MSHTMKNYVPFNEIEGTASTNVPAYSNRNGSNFNIGRHYFHGIYTGFQWQCVEYARRWLLIRKSCVFKDVLCACNIWSNVRYIERVTDGQQFPLRAVANGSPEPPKKDSLLIYARSLRMPYGHVAIITDVVADHVHIAEQNNLYTYWSGDYARRASLRFQNGLYYIDDGDKIYGWMEIEDNGQLQPFDESNKDNILQQYIYREPTGIFARLFTSNKKKDSK
jgi:trypanothione synthetase/amidase